MEKLIRIPPPLIALALLGITYALGRLFPNLPAVSQPTAGALLIGSGAVLATSALADFLRRRTSFIPHGEPSTLVVEGPFVWTRNPMYLGLFTFMLGVALYVGSMPMLLAPVAFHDIINRTHILFEENRLSKLFGERYERYRRRVGRWL
jgi:protein-S-isoprenylcysteine O-methyltransferase Ste14